MNSEEKRSALAPGASLCVIGTDRFKTGRISVNLAMPLRAETAAAYALLPFYLHRACAAYPDFSRRNSRLAELYGAILSARVEKLGEAQVMRIAVSYLDDRFALTRESIGAQCASLLCELLFCPLLQGEAFDTAALEQEKRLLIERIENERNDKRAYALNRCTELMCAGEAYGVGRYGTPEQVAALTPETMYRTWQSVLKTARIQVNVVGETDTDAVARMLREGLEAVGREEPVVIETAFLPRAGQPRTVEEQLPIKQGKLVLGFRTGNRDAQDDLFATRVMADLYGGGPYSRLFLNVREKLSLCYYCSARFYRLKGLMMVQSGIEPQNRDKAQAEILRQLDCVRNGAFSDGELDASRAGLSDALLTVGDMPEDLDDWYMQQMLLDAPLSPQAFADGVRAVTREQVAAAANRVTLDLIYLLSGTGEEDAS